MTRRDAFRAKTGDIMATASGYNDFIDSCQHVMDGPRTHQDSSTGFVPHVDCPASSRRQGLAMAL